MAAKSGNAGRDIERGLADEVQSLTFNRIDKKSAINSAMYGVMTEALREGNKDPSVRVHLVLGSRNCFTAGNDLADFLAMNRSDEFDPNVHDFLRALAANEKPLIAAVDGLAVGIGTTLLLHCDLVYASPRATFSAPFVHLGLVPEAASSLLMPERIGCARAFEMLCLGARFSAERALLAGFVNALVAPEELEATARGAALELAAKPEQALRAARRMLRRNRGLVQDVIEEEIALLETCLKSVEVLEAFDAFLEKRSIVSGHGRAAAGE